MTYAEVAVAAGSIAAHRAVASIMKANYDSAIPCHRVIRSDRSAGGYNRGGPVAKLMMLASEGCLMRCAHDPARSVVLPAPSKKALKKK